MKKINSEKVIDAGQSLTAAGICLMAICGLQAISYFIMPGPSANVYEIREVQPFIQFISIASALLGVVSFIQFIKAGNRLSSCFSDSNEE